MSTSTPSQSSAGARVIRGPDELINAIPYMLGFRPHESLVLVALAEQRHIVTARMDLADVVLSSGAVVDEAVATATNGGASAFVAVVFSEADDGPGDPPRPDDDAILPPGVVALPRRRGHLAHARAVLDGRQWPGTRAAAAAFDAVQRTGAILLDAFLVRSGRVRSYVCDGECCPPQGWELTEDTSSYVAQAVMDGTVVLPDRAARVATLDPSPDREELRAPLERARARAAREIDEGRGARLERSATRRLFVAARTSHEPGWTPPPAEALAQLAALLNVPGVRESYWYAIEEGRVDGRPLLHELAVRCPSPHDAAPLFLYGWACWRAGNTMLADLAATRALASVPDYNAADMLHSAVTNGLDPHHVPRIRRPRNRRR